MLCLPVICFPIGRFSTKGICCSVLLVGLLISNVTIRAQPATEPLTEPDKEQQPQPEPKTDPNPGGNTPEEKPSGPRFLNLYPSLLMQSAELDIKGRTGKAYMRPANPISFQPSIDFRSRDLEFLPRIGVNLIGHASTFDFNKQIVQSAPSGETSEEGGGGSTSTTEDLGTRISGNYSYLAPAAYIRFSDDPDSGRFGIGYGYGRVKIQGTFETDDPTLLYFGLRLLRGEQRDVVLRDMSLVYVGSGLLNVRNGDPVFTYLMLDLRSGRNLEAMGYYMIAKGWRPTFDNILMIFALQSYARQTGQSTNLGEMIALAALTKGSANFTAEKVPVWRMFVEFPVAGNFRGYVNAAYARFKVGTPHYELTMLNAAITYRLSL